MNVVNAADLRIGVVGAGVGGAFTTKFLRELGVNATIEVFDANERAGGRVLDTTTLLGEPLAQELGASMAITQNRYVRDAADKLGLKRRSLRDSPGRGSGRLAVVGADGAIAFTESGFAPLTVARLLRRYGGRSLRNVKGVASEFIANFSRLYDAQDAGRAFRSPRDLLAEASMEEWPARACGAALGEVAAEGTAELVEALMRNNYGQAAAPAGALCCFTAVAPLAAGGSKAAFKIEGGNAQLAARLLARANASTRFGHRVTAVERSSAPAGGGEPSRPFRLRFVGADKVEGSRRFDYVVLAAPPTPKLELSELRGAAWLRRGGLEYTRVHTTLVWGLLDPAAFGRARSRREVRELNAFGDVLVAGGGGGLNISSFGRIDATDAKGGGAAAAAPAAAVAGCADYPGVAVPRWKLFSPAALDDAALGRALVWHDPGTVVRHAWETPGAYPLSRPRDADGDGALAAGRDAFVLDELPGGMVLFPSALEAATSAMEVAAVGAKNAALLVAAHIAEPPPPPPPQPKEEL